MDMVGSGHCDPVAMFLHPGILGTLQDQCGQHLQDEYLWGLHWRFSVIPWRVAVLMFLCLLFVCM